MSKKKYTREERREFRNRNKGIVLFTSVIVGMFLAITGYFIFNLLKLSGIEDFLRYIFIGILAIVCIFVVINNFKLRSQPKKLKFILFILLLIIFGFGEYYLSHIINRGVSIVDNLNKDEFKYTSALIKMSSNESLSKKNINDAKIGIISDEDDTEGYVLAQKLIKKYELSLDNIFDYDEYVTMLKALYSGEIDACFISAGYVEKYKNISDFENIKDDVKVIDKYSKMMKKQNDKKIEVSNKSVTEPFTMLLLGVDSTEEDINEAYGLGDTIILVTFNPNTLNATIFSIPRDTYTPITCYNNAMSKITHAASGGDSCMITSVEKLTGIDIDYYAKVNFRGLMSIVDNLGGIDVEVPYAFCETTMWRSQEYMVYVEKGYQHLNGEQALGLARNRHYYDSCDDHYNQGDRNDFIRGQNQQLVIKSILNKVKKIRSVDQFYDILDTVSISMDTNMTREQILGFYNVLKKIILSTDSLTDTNDIISMQRTYLNGGGGIIYDEIAGTGLYEFVPSQNGLDEIIHAMRVNLELEEEVYDTSFTFNIDKPFEQEIIGKDTWGGGRHYELWSPEEEAPTCTNPNEELGADGKTCVCKNGYKKNKKGVCEKVEATCNEDANEELGADEVTCVCKYGYTRDDDGVCVEDSGSGSGSSSDNPDEPVTPTEPETPTEPTEPSEGNEENNE